jgi:hypothetical protein
MNLDRVYAEWRASHPYREYLTDAEVLDQMLLSLCKTHPERFTKSRGRDGKWIWKILPPNKETNV